MNALVTYLEVRAAAIRRLLDRTLSERGQGTVEYVGKVLFTKFLFPFEVTSLLLLAAIVGAVILAKKRIS